MVNAEKDEDLTGSKISARIVCPAIIKKVPVNPPSTLIDVKVRKSGAAAAPTEQMNRTNMAVL